jgi:hypothetical protein
VKGSQISTNINRQVRHIDIEIKFSLTQLLIVKLKHKRHCNSFYIERTQLTRPSFLSFGFDLDLSDSLIGYSYHSINV